LTNSKSIVDDSVDIIVEFPDFLGAAPLFKIEYVSDKFSNSSSASKFRVNLFGINGCGDPIVGEDKPNECD
jgi:predicted metallopeptidase